MSLVFWGRRWVGGVARPSARPFLSILTVLKGAQMKGYLVSFLLRLHQDESGQGLVEYLLIIALVAFAATAGMNILAVGLNNAFSDIGSLISAYIV